MSGEAGWRFERVRFAVPVVRIEKLDSMGIWK